MAYVQPHVPKPPPDFSPEYPPTRALRAARDLIHQGYPPVFVFEQLGSAPGEVVTFSVTATDAHDPAPLIECAPASGSFFPAGTTLVTCTAMDAAGNQSTCEFTVTVEPKKLPRRF